MAVGIVGTFIGSWLLPKLGIVLGSGMVAAIINATVGAAILLFIIKLVQGRRGGAGGGEQGRLQQSPKVAEASHVV